jgi:ABC-type multidrug transport system fused ATPase/permease subunit
MRKFIVIIVCIILLVLILSYFVDKDCFDNDKFSLILNIINGTQIFVTIIVAYLVYDRFGTSRKLLDKQNDIVIEYIEEIKNIRLHIYEWTGENVYQERNAGIGRNIHFKYIEKDKPVLFKSGFYASQKVKRLNKLVNHPLFPIEIIKKVDIFSFPVMTATFSDYRQGYVFISFENESNFIMNDWMLAGDSHEESLTINQLIKQLENLLETLENWVNKESSIKIKLNF